MKPASRMGRKEGGGEREGKGRGEIVEIGKAGESCRSR